MRAVPLVASLLLLLACGTSVSVGAVVSGGGGEGAGGGAGGGGLAPPSCAARQPGADNVCGANHDLDCCAATMLPGGTFDHLNDPDLPATVSPFALDVLEATVGRFRAFVDAYPGSRPLPGDGAHPLIAGSGWLANWDGEMPQSQAGLLELLQCGATTPASPSCEQMASWTTVPAAGEYLPMTLVTWYLAFAFCAWDDGRLPTTVEWSFAAAGGSEQRSYPWGEAPIDSAHAVYKETPQAWAMPVGSALLGSARWGQLDLNGSRFEWMLDQMLHIDPMPQPCVDCAVLDPDTIARLVRDMSFLQPAAQTILYQNTGTDTQSSEALGFRCARNP